MSEQHIPHIQLFGNPEENFYSLGRRDKNGHALMYDQISKLCARSEHMASILKLVTELSAKFKQKKSDTLHKELQAYADGLEKPVDDIYFMLLLPEIVASFNKWLPHLLGVIPGCSSLFVKDAKNGGIIHGRILDYALAGPFEEYERCISYEFKNRLKSFSYSTVGMPFPSLTSMNEKGLTMALHYKHGDYFDQEGESIFSIMYQLTSYCTNVQEVKKYLKSTSSISYWGIYVSDQNGEVASFDIKGRDIFQEKFDIHEHKYLYFNNRPLLKSHDDENLQPFGNMNQCLMRNDVIQKKMQDFNYQAKDLCHQVLKNLTRLEPIISESAKDWKLSPVTPSSIQAVAFHNKLYTSYCLGGKSPKIYTGQMMKFENIFKQVSQKEVLYKYNNDANYLKGQNFLAMAQSSMDSGHIERAYHNLQMAIEYFHEYPDKCIAEFFFLVWQYIHEESHKDLAHIYHQFKAIEGKLPSYLNQHCLLFLMRLNKILELGNDDELLQKIKHQKLKEIYLKEIKMKPIALKFLKRFIIPRIEILDIIYIYA